MSKIISILSVLLLSGCALFQPSLPSKQEILDNYDVNQLKSTDKTFRLTKPQVVEVYDKEKKTEVIFDTTWFVVSTDLMKTYNENQNTIITLLNDRKQIQEKILKYVSLSTIPVCLILILLAYKYGKNRKV